MIKSIFYCVLALLFFSSPSLFAKDAAVTTKDDVIVLPEKPSVLAEKEKAIKKIREMLAQGDEVRQGIEGFTIEGDAPDGEILVNGIRLEDLDGRPMAELLVALTEKFHEDTVEYDEEAEDPNEEMQRMKELQEQNERIRQHESIQRTQQMLRQTQIQSQRPPQPPTLPASRPPVPPAPPAPPSRR